MDRANAASEPGLAARGVTTISQPGPQLALDRTSPDTLTVRLSGTWRMSAGLPSSEPLQAELAAAPPVRRIAFDTRDVTTWDTGLVAFAVNVLRLAEARRLAVDRGGLPRGVQRLLGLAEAVPESKTRTADTHASWLAGVGAVAIAAGAAVREVLRFIGEATLALGRLLCGTARFRSSDLALIVQECGANALPIMTLVSFLVGLILSDLMDRSEARADDLIMGVEGGGGSAAHRRTIGRRRPP